MEQLSQLKVLLLNVGYEPLRIIGWQTAITMAYLDKVEVLAEYSVLARSQHEVWNIPAVIRLFKKPHHYLPLVKLTREHLFTRDGFRCGYCNEVFKPRDLTYDHVIPRSRGGKLSWTNIITCCIGCNQKKGNRTPKEAGMNLHKIPEKPKWFPQLVADAVRETEAPEEWEPFVNWLRKG